MRAKYLMIVALPALCISAFVDRAAPQANPLTETLSGVVVVDAGGGIPARGTQIWIHEAKGSASYTVQQDSTGAFRISLPEGYYFVFIANLGLVPYAKEIWLEHGKPVKLMVKLEPDWDIMQDARAK